MSDAKFLTTRLVPEILEKSFDTLKPFAMVAAIKTYDIRRKQREEGNFDCFGRAASGYCDQLGCIYHAECIEISQTIPGLISS